MDQFHSKIPRSGCRCCRDAPKVKLRRMARARLRAALIRALR